MDQQLPGTEEILRWQEQLAEWFLREGKDYPWRRTTDPYAILVSEMMLQQTQIAAVLEKGYFETWMKRFPGVRELARAREDEVLKAWEGLGYYNRARHLQKAAALIVERYRGKFPQSMEEIRALPGVGPYTAGAVMSFAFDRRAPIVDGNVIRVVSRVFDFRQPVDDSAGRRQINAWASLLTPENGARVYNSAIMELGQRICRPSRPACERCPVADLCSSAGREWVESLPVKRKTAAVTRRQERVLLAIREGKILLQRESGRRRRGLWKLPEIAPSELSELSFTGTIRYAITRYQVEMTVLAGSASVLEASGKELAWFHLTEELPALGAPYLRAIQEFSGKVDL